MAVGDIGMIQQDGQQDQAIVLDEAYKSGYYDGTGGRKQSASFDNRMMSMLLDCPLPKDNDDFDNYLEMIRVVIDILPRIPNYDMATYHELTRDFEDIVDQAHSEGMSRVTASDMCKVILRLRAIMPAGGQFEMKGLTPVSAIITTRHQSESTVKVPTQSPQPSGGTFGFLNPFNWGRR